MIFLLYFFLNYDLVFVSKYTKTRLASDEYNYKSVVFLIHI